MNKFAYFTALPLLALLISPAEPAASTGSPPPPNPDAVILIQGNKNWSLEELNKVAFAEILARGALPSHTTNMSVIVHIPLNDRTNMCEFLYVRGFGQPTWRVRLGYDGKPLSVTRRIKREG